MRAAVALLCLFALGQPGEARRHKHRTSEAESLRQAMSTTMLIDTEHKNGSGTIVYSDGKYALILTCQHVIAGEKVIRVWSPDTGFVPASLEKASKALDLALLSVEHAALPVIRLADHMPGLYARVYVGGSPNGDFGQVSEGFLTARSIRLLGDPGGLATYYRITGAVIYPGISGGTVFGSDGALICVPARGEEYDAGYCIGLANVRSFLSGYSL